MPFTPQMMRADTTPSQGRSALGAPDGRRDSEGMTGTQHDQRARPPVDDGAREIDELAPDPTDEAVGDELPARLDVPIEQPVEDVIESLQSAGDTADEYEPHS